MNRAPYRNYRNLVLRTELELEKCLECNFGPPPSYFSFLNRGFTSASSGASGRATISSGSNETLETGKIPTKINEREIKSYIVVREELLKQFRSDAMLHIVQQQSYMEIEDTEILLMYQKFNVGRQISLTIFWTALREIKEILRPIDLEEIFYGFYRKKDNPCFLNELSQLELLMVHQTGPPLVGVKRYLLALFFVREFSAIYEKMMSASETIRNSCESYLTKALQDGNQLLFQIVDNLLCETVFNIWFENNAVDRLFDAICPMHKVPKGGDAITGYELFQEAKDILRRYYIHKKECLFVLIERINFAVNNVVTVLQGIHSLLATINLRDFLRFVEKEKICEQSLSQAQ